MSLSMNSLKLILSNYHKRLSSIFIKQDNILASGQATLSKANNKVTIDVPAPINKTVLDGLSDDNGTLKYNDKSLTTSDQISDFAKIVHLTQAEYDALSETYKNSNNIYIID